MPIPPDVVRCYKYVDRHSKIFIEELKQLVEIPNVSSDINSKKHLSTLVKWMCNRLTNLGFNVLLKQPEFSSLQKSKGNNPPIILGTLGTDPNKKTLLYYCHLDVLKVNREEWKTDPYKLTEKDGKLYGRGSAKMKGPLLCFIHAVESYRELGIDIPINIKIICESMFECQSKGLKGILNTLKSTYLVDVDCVLMTESCWLGRDYPCVVYGMRGVVYFSLSIEGPKKDLSSGDYGGIVREPMQDLMYIMGKLVGPFDKVLVPHFYDDVVQVTPDEEEFYRNIKLDSEEYRKSVAVDKLGHDNNLKSVLMHVWRYPWLNLHYIDSSCEESNVLNIPKKVLARFSIRTVPNQKSEKIAKQIVDYVNEIVKQIKSPNKVDISAEHPLDPWYEDYLHWSYEAANIATKQVYKENASFIREGNGFPTLLKLRDAVPKRNILMLPIVNSEAGSHTEEENISIKCYIEGTKLLASYLYELQFAAKRYTEKNMRSKQNICRGKL